MLGSALENSMRREKSFDESIRGCERAFTRADLVVLILAVSVLLVLQMPSLANTRRNGNASVCVAHLQQLSRAWRLYADDNSDRLVGNLDGGGVSTLSNSNKTWVLGWMDFSGGIPAGADTDTRYLAVYSPLAPYANRSAEIFKCPEDQSLSLGNRGAQRVRSVSMNGYLGERASPFTPGYRQFKKITEMATPGPARTWIFLDEREESINDGFFVVDMSGYPNNPNALRIVDFPAAYHASGAGVSFADGHAQIKTWLDPRTSPVLRPGQPLPLGGASPNNLDVLWLQERSTSRIN